MSGLLRSKINLKKSLPFALLVLALLSPGCTRATSGDQFTPYPIGSPTKDAGALDSLSGAQIVFTRDGGIAGTSDQWSVFGDGRFLSLGNPDKQVDLSSLAKLLNGLEQSDFFDLHPPSDPFSSCADCFTYTLAVTYKDRSNQISWKDGDPELSTALQNIAALVTDFFIVNPPVHE